MTKTQADTGGHVARLEAAEREALATLPADLAAVAGGDPARFFALHAAQDADRTASDEFSTELAALRLAAIASDERQRLAHPGRGRPPLSDERKSYRQAQQDADEAPDRASLAAANWMARIGELKEAAPAIAALDDQADEQRRLCEQVVKHLRGAAVTYREAIDLADDGRAVMARYGRLVTWSHDPFLRLDESAGFLDAILQRVSKRHEAEALRVGGNPDEEIAAMRARHEIEDYKIKLDAAAEAYRGTPEGAALWHRYATAMKQHEALDGGPDYDRTYQRDQLQTALDIFHGKAAAREGLSPQPEHYPQLG